MNILSCLAKFVGFFSSFLGFKKISSTNGTTIHKGIVTVFYSKLQIFDELFAKQARSAGLNDNTEH